MESTTNKSELKHESSKKTKKGNMRPKKRGSGDLGLDFIEQFGGVKGDLELLADVDNDDDDGEALDAGEDLDAEPIARDEIQDLIHQLDIAKHRPVTVVVEEKKKKVKLAVKEGDKEEPESSTPTLTKESKSRKNKYKIQDTAVSSTSEVTSTGGDRDDTVTKNSVVSAPIIVQQLVEKHKPRKYLLIKPGGHWYDHAFATDPTSYEEAPDHIVLGLERFAAQLYEEEIALYKKQQDKRTSSDVQWLRTILSSGTLNDRIAALTVIIQESPIHMLSSLDTMISMVHKRGRREFLIALDTLKELFISDLLTETKLRTFEQHPLMELNKLSSGNRDTRDRRLLLWYYEAKLKALYSRFVDALQTISHDTLPAVKKKSLELLHQETAHELLLNLLDDGIYELLASKPEQEKLLLSLLVNKLGDPDHKLAAHTSHLLSKLVEKHPNMKVVVVLEVEQILYRRNVAVKAQYYGVCFLNKIVLASSDCALAGRLINIYFSFFKAFAKKNELDSKMLSGLLTGVNRAYPFAKGDHARIEGQMNTLYRIIHKVNINTSIQAFMLLYHVMDISDSSSDRFFIALYRKMLDPGLMSSSKQPVFLNLLFKSMKKDLVIKRTQAFVKRLLQLCSQQTPTFICSVLMLLSELFKVKPGLLRVQKIIETDSDDEEFHDLPSEDEADPSKHGEVEEPSSGRVSAADTCDGASWLHRKQGLDWSTNSDYDPHHRNPLYSRAEHECTFELERLTHHFHPTVVLFSQTLLKGEEIMYTGDPLEDFALVRFLDRFVYRNPKSVDKIPKTQSVLQPRHKSYTPVGARALAVNTKEYLEEGEENIPVDEHFFYRYFSKKAEQEKEKLPEGYDSDASEVSDDDFDEYLEKFEHGLVEDGNTEMDFAGEMNKKMSKKQTGDLDDDDDDNELSDEEVDFSDDGEFDMDFDGSGDEDEYDDMDELDDDEMLDEEMVEFSDDDLAELENKEAMKSSRGKKRKATDSEGDLFGLPSSRKSRHKEKDTASLFAAAEKFADLIDEEAGTGMDNTGTDAVANRDKATAKQLRWEKKRDEFMQNRDWRSLKKGKAPGRGGKGWPHGNQSGKRMGGHSQKGKKANIHGKKTNMKRSGKKF